VLRSRDRSLVRGEVVPEKQTRNWVAPTFGILFWALFFVYMSYSNGVPIDQALRNLMTADGGLKRLEELLLWLGEWAWDTARIGFAFYLFVALLGPQRLARWCIRVLDAAMAPPPPKEHV
jgi:hypothetical protein